MRRKARTAVDNYGSQSQIVCRLTSGMATWPAPKTINVGGGPCTSKNTGTDSGPKETVLDTLRLISSTATICASRSSSGVPNVPEVSPSSTISSLCNCLAAEWQ